ncbi:Large proline-rich protein bag6 [Asimina triloba]
MHQPMKIDPSEPPINFKPYPNPSCFGYSNPTEYHGCCNHSCPPGFYSFMPPHSHSPPPPSPPPGVYYRGPYPSCPEAFPAYFVPPNYPLEQAAYKYGKNMGREDCCGCPNHSHNGKAESNVHIEEEKPDVEQKDKDTGMMKWQNNPYPIVWYPPSYMKNKESNKQSESPDPKGWNGWVPLGLNSIKPFLWGEEEKKNKGQQIEDNTHFPFPIVSMPGHDNPKEIEKKDVKDINARPNNSEDRPKFRIIPVKLLENGDNGEKPGVAEEAKRGADTSNVSKKETSKANTAIPKQVEESRNKDSETASKSIPVKQVEANKEKKPPEESREKQPSVDNGKVCKLSPVCLRVDPLPKKKNGNGTSRSSSPPCLKDRVQKNSKSKEPVHDKVDGEEPKKKEQSPANKVEQPSCTKAVVQDVANNTESKKREIKVIEVQDKESKEAEEVLKEKDMKAIEIESNKTVPSDEAKQEIAAEKEPGVEVKKKIITESKKGGPSNDRVEVQVGAHANSSEVVPERSNVETVETKGRKKELSCTDAAVLIQAAYRGLQVRKWEPVKKMKQIAKVLGQIPDIKETIDRLEASGDFQQYEKQRLIISETIMNLLLQLDAIQGLHPSVREVRKSVAKELVCLQEKLDSLAAQRTGIQMSIVPELVPQQMVSKDCPEAVEDASPSTVAQAPPEPAVALKLTTAGKATVEEEDVKQTAMNTKQLHENDHVEIESLSLVEDEGQKTQQELAVELSSPSDNRISSSGSDQLLEDHVVGNGSLDAVTQVLAESLLSADQGDSVPLESVVLEVEKRVDSETDGCMRNMNDDVSFSAMEKQSGVPSIQNDEEPPSDPLLVAEPKAEPQKDEEPALEENFTETQSADNIKEDSHAELPGASGDLNPLLECEQTSAAKDSNEDSVKVLPVELLQREGEPELGIRQLLGATEPAEKDEEHKCMLDVEIETPSPESLVGATANEVSELSPEMNMKAESYLEQLPILSESMIGFDSADDEHAQHSEVGGSDVVAPIKDVANPDYEGSKMVELATAVIETENATVAENVQEKLLETEVAEKEAAEAENEVASTATQVILEPVELGCAERLPDGFKISARIATQAKSPVSKQQAAPIATQLESSGLKTSKALETEDMSLSLEAAGAPVVEAGTHFLELADAVSEVPSSAGMWKGSAAEGEKGMDGTEALKEMLEKLVEAGKQQLAVISDLSRRVRDLEKQLAHKNKLKGKKRSLAVRPPRRKNMGTHLGGQATATAV